MKKYMPSSEEERKFLESYDASIYEKPGFAADGALFAIDFEEKCLKLLLIKRGGFPYKGCFALPGGFVNIDEDILTAVKRELLEETGIEDIELKQYHTFGAPDRDPRSRVITTSFVGLTDIKKVNARAGDDAAVVEWVKVSDYNRLVAWEGSTYIINRSITLKGSEILTPSVETRETLKKGGVSATTKIVSSGGLAFDHALSVILAYEALIEELKKGFIVSGAILEDINKAENVYNIIAVDKNKECIESIKEHLKNFRKKG
ncbi:MAG: NUDIX hydrolase [Eubacteriales bacterium]